MSRCFKSKLSGHKLSLEVIIVTNAMEPWVETSCRCLDIRSMGFTTSKGFKNSKKSPF